MSATYVSQSARRNAQAPEATEEFLFMLRNDSLSKAEIDRYFECASGNPSSSLEVENDRASTVSSRSSSSSRSNRSSMTSTSCTSFTYTPHVPNYAQMRALDIELLQIGSQFS